MSPPPTLGDLEAPESARREDRPVLRRVLLVVLPLAVLGFSAWGFLQFKKMRKPPARRATHRGAPAVRTLRLVPRSTTLDIEGYGSVRAKRLFLLAPQVAGRVVKIAPSFKTGGFVKAGEVLVEIDPTDYRIAVETAKARLGEARAQVLRLEQSEINLKREIEVLREKVSVSKNEYVRVERAWRVEKGAVTKNERDRARAAYLQDRTNLVIKESARALIPSQLASARAVAKARQAALDQARVDLERTRLKTPFDGRVMERKVEVGQYVTTFPATGVGRLADTRACEVPVMIEPEQMRNLPGLPMRNVPSGKPFPPAFLSAPKAAVRWLAHKGRFTWTGRVVRAEPLDPKSRTVPLVVEVPNPWRDLAPGTHPPLVTGAYCQVTIEGRRLERALILPARAVHEGGQVYVVQNGRLLVRKIRIRHRFHDEVVVEKGLAPGEEVVVSPLAFPVPGMAVQALPSEEPVASALGAHP